VLTKEEADRFAVPEKVAKKLMLQAFYLGKKRRPAGQQSTEYVHQQLECLGIEVKSFKMGRRTIKLPPSTLRTASG
jgi:hypothetical protein